MKIKHFTYNGFTGQLGDGFAPYTGTFVRWTNDPGIAVIACSDGKERLIPTFALERSEGEALPPQDMSNKVIVGARSSST